MNKSELIQTLADQTDLPKTSVTAVIDALGETITQQLAQDQECVLPGLGKFKVTHRAARQAHNPATGEPMTVPAKRTPAFRAIKALKDALN